MKKISKEHNEKKEPKKSKAIKPLILTVCVFVVGISVYADWNFSQKAAEDVGGYIYNSAVTGEQAKILGEATYVGSSADISEQTVSDEASSESYFAVAALERQKSRDETLGLLQTVVDSQESMPDAKNQALMDMTSIASAMEAETNIETLIKAKGFDDCIAVVGQDDVNVIVKTAGLLTYEVAQIREIVMNELDIPAEKIKIIEKSN